VGFRLDYGAEFRIPTLSSVFVKVCECGEEQECLHSHDVDVVARIEVGGLEKRIWR
jgi:hypothetical protein